jgi:tetratricopeptide (TPR) repeat protein
MKFICHTPTCVIAISKASFPVAVNCPVCQTALHAVMKTHVLSIEDQKLIEKLPYLIAYPLQQTLWEEHAWTRLNLFKDTFLNYLKYLGLLSASEFFHCEIKDKGMVQLFQQNLIETAFGKWNHYIRGAHKFFKENNVNLFCNELVQYYEIIETGNKSKKYKAEIEFIDANGYIQYKKQETTGIGMLVNFRNRYLGHGLTLDSKKSEELWNQYFPIFRNLLELLNFPADYRMHKRERGVKYLLHSAEIKPVEGDFPAKSNIWIQNKVGEVLEILPFFITPGEVSLADEDIEQMLTYESYTGRTIVFFSPEGTEKQTSGQLLEKLNLLIRDKQKEIPFSPENFTRDEFLNRIAIENKILLEILVNEKKIIPGIYQNREEMESKLRQWIGAQASIFFIAADAGSGKTNLLVEIQKQYAAECLPCILIRAGRMEKQSLKQQLAYILNVDSTYSLENYSSMAGTQAAPTLILIDGLNEANNSNEIWMEVLWMCTLFEKGSLKFVVTCRANTKDDIDSYKVSRHEQQFLYGDNTLNLTGLSPYANWLAPLDMSEIKGAWDRYAARDKSRFKPQFTFDSIATFDRDIYNQINNPLVLRLFLEIYNGKTLPQKGGEHLNIWGDWLKTFSIEEQHFFKLLAEAAWNKGENELLLDELIKDNELKPFLTSEITNTPYMRLKNIGWISSYTKDVDSFVSFTVEASLLHLIGKKLQEQVPQFSLKEVQAILQKENKFQKAALEVFLGEEALSGNLDLVSAIIDAEELEVAICTNALRLFLIKFGVETALNEILGNPTERDWEALNCLINQLEELQLQQIRKELLIALLPINKLETKNQLRVGTEACGILDKLDSELYMLKIEAAIKKLALDDCELLFALGTLNQKNAEFCKAIDYFNKSLAIRLRVHGENHPATAMCYNNLGSVWVDKGEYGVAIEYYNKSLSIHVAALGEQHNDTAVCYNNLGYAWDCNEEYGKAIEYYERSLAIELKLLGEQHSAIGITYNNLGVSWHQKGDYNKAIKYLEKSLAIQSKVLGEEHLATANCYNNLGFLYDKNDQYDKAIKYHEKSLAIFLKAHGEQHPATGKSYKNLGSVWGHKGDYDKAIEYFQKSLSIKIKYNQNSELESVSFNLGEAYKNNKQYKEAIDYLSKAYGIQKDDNCAFLIGESYEIIGVLDKACDYFIECAEMRKERLGIEDDFTKAAITKSKSLVKQLGADIKLPEWMVGF